MSDRAESGTVASASRRRNDCEFPVDIVYEHDLTGCSAVIASPSSDGDGTRLRCGTKNRAALEPEADVGRVSRSFDGQLEVVPVDLDLT